MQNIKKTKDLLDTLKAWIDDIPPLESPQRFGNRAFRDWMQRLEQHSDELHRELLEPKFHPAIIELSAYFKVSFGNGIFNLT
jgi:serine/threonine-protein phosphatase 2A activator